MGTTGNEKGLYPEEQDIIDMLWYDGDWNDAILGLQHIHESRNNTKPVGERQQDRSDDAV